MILEKWFQAGVLVILSVFAAVKSYNDRGNVRETGRAADAGYAVRDELRAVRTDRRWIKKVFNCNVVGACSPAGDGGDAYVIRPSTMSIEVWSGGGDGSTSRYGGGGGSGSYLGTGKMDVKVHGYGCGYEKGVETCSGD